jgi:hypothetical protein
VAVWKPLVWIGISALLLTNCFVRRRTVFVPGSKPAHPPLVASREELIQRARNVSDPLESFLARVNMSPSTLSKEVITDYATISGYLVFQQPDRIRLMGQDPILNTTIFDMTSAGREFRLYIPNRKEFIVGNNDAPPASKNPLENLRPNALLTAVLIAPPNPEKEIVLLEDDSGSSKAIYILLIIGRNDEKYRLLRNIYFDRYTLDIARQKTFDVSGHITSETEYANWKRYGRVSFPSDIDIKRPQENYEVQLNVVGLKANSADITPDKFLLDQPSGTRLHRLE